MNKTAKIVLIVIGGALVLSAVTYFLYQWLSAPKEDKRQRNNNRFNDGDNTGDEPVEIDTDEGFESVYNEEGELNAPLLELKKVMLYPKPKEEGGWGFTNVRTSAGVNNDQGWWDFSDNKLTTIQSNTPIGKAIDETTDEYNGYAYRWLKIKLEKSIGFWGTTEGYVRADTVTYKTEE